MASDSLERTRIIVSGRLISPLSCCDDFNQKAIRFRQSVESSAQTERLFPDIAVKALNLATGTQKQTYDDTDGKKRDFTGDLRPGMDQNKAGYRWEKAKTWSPGDELFLTPRYSSRFGMKNTPNFGWINPTENQEPSRKEAFKKIGSKPGIEIRKYKVNQKTDDIIPESERLIDPFSIASGMTAEERQKKRSSKKIQQLESKILPGRSLSSRVPGGTLIARAAAAFGVLVDERNKFRCPPGTPAANQFTDAMGTNCFGFSASRFARFAARQAAKITSEGGYSGLRDNAKSFFGFLYTDTWSMDRRGVADPEFMGRVAYWDSISGDKYKPPSWRDVPVPENLRLFKNGAIRGQDDIARQKANVRTMYESLGIDPDDKEAPVLAMRALAELHKNSGGNAGWNIEMLDVSSPDDRLMSELEVREFVEARLQSVTGWYNLTQAEQQRLINSDTERYYETQRAMLETMLDQFIQDPSTARMIGQVRFNFLTDDEASTSFYKERKSVVPVLAADGSPVLDEDGEPVMRVIGGDIRTAISINMGMTMANQETMLPSMGPDERLAISAVGARSEAEARSAVADFLTNTDHSARGMAGLLDGVYSFSSHIMLHEGSHSIQGMAFIEQAQNEIASKGYIDVPQIDSKGMIRGTKRVSTIEQLNGDDLMVLMTRVSDGINLESMKDAMARLKDVAPVAGAYPRDVFAEGSEEWALEVAAELYALRSRGIIYGDDIDAALAFMDSVKDGRSAADRAVIEERAKRAAEEAGTSSSPDSVDDVVPDVDEEALGEALDEVHERTIEDVRKDLESWKSIYPELNEDEMFFEAAVIEAKREYAESLIKELEDTEIGPDMPEADRYSAAAAKERGLRDARLSYDFFDAQMEFAKKAWKRKFGLGSRKDGDRFDEAVRSTRERFGLISEEETKEIAKTSRLKDLRASAERSSPKQLTRRIADEEIRLKALKPGSEEARNKIDDIEALTEQFVENAKRDGDRRTSAQIRRELTKNVKTLVSPPPKKNKSFKTGTEVKEHAAKERRRLKATKEQREALVALGDVSESDIGQLLNPSTQTRAGRAINARNARLKRMGLEVDEKSPAEGDIVQQIENLLIPTMEAIDSSSIGEPFELETVIEFPRRSLRGAAEGREISVGKFIGGRPVVKKMPKLDIPEKGIVDKGTDTVSRRTIIQIKEGDRGIFPRAGESEQRFVAPPGKIRITGIDDDGTVRAEISYQQDAVEVIDSMAESIERNEGDKIWRTGASRKIKAAADRYVVKRRESGASSPGARSDSPSYGAESSDDLLDEVVEEAGGVFGSAPDDPSDTRSLSSGRTHFGKLETRSERKTKRRKKLSSAVRDYKTALSSGSSESGITRADIDKDVANLIINTPEEELIQIAEDSAYRLHSGFDRRVRVRARDEDIEMLVQNGAIRSPFSSMNQNEDGATRRALRRSSGTTRPSRQSMSSGLTIDSPERLRQRREMEKQTAQRAVEIFSSIIDSRKNVDDMTDDEITEAFNGMVVRSLQKSISAKNSNVYNADDIPTAIALMMLGHHVAVNNQDVRLTAQAQDDFEKMVKDVAKTHIESGHEKWIQFKDKFKRENQNVDINSPDVLANMKRQYVEQYQADLCSLYDPSKNLMCSGHIGIDREKMPQTNGRTVGHRTPAIRALKEGLVAGKFEPLGTITPNRIVETEFADELDAAVRKANIKRNKDGKPPLDEQGILAELYSIIASRHSVRDEFGKSAIDHRDNSWSNLSNEAKNWLYANTNWQNTEVNLESPFISFLNDVLGKSIKDPQNGAAVRRRTVNPAEYAPSQQQLVASKVNGMASTIQAEAISTAERIKSENPGLSGDEFRDAYLLEMGKQWFMSPILTTMDKFILDGHHRWGGIVVANMSLPEDLQIPLNVNEVQTDIVEGLTLGKVFQNAWGIKEARLGVENPWEVGEISPVTTDDIEKIGSDLRSNVGSLVDDIYASGDYIQLGSVGLTNNPDYGQIVKDRRIISLLARSNSMAAARERASQIGESISRADIRRARRTNSNRRDFVGASSRFSSGRTALSANRQEGSFIPEPSKTSGLSPEMFARDYYSTIGIPRSVKTTTLPVSGYLTHRSHIDAKRKAVSESMNGNLNSNAIFEVNNEDLVGDGLTAHGDIEIVLKPSVSRRTAYGSGEAISSGHRPVLLNSRNRDDVADALLNFDGSNSDSRSRESLINMLSASIDGDFSRTNARRKKDGRFLKTGTTGKDGDSGREPFEAQILGGFDIDEIEQINFPYSRIQELGKNEDITDVVNKATIADRLRAAGFSEEEIDYFYSIGGTKSLNTETMEMLRNYRAAKKVKASYADNGLPNVKIAHPTGLDIEDPKTYGKGQRIGQSPEDVLINAIMRDITTSAQKLLKEMRSEPIPRVLSERGARI